MATLEEWTAWPTLPGVSPFSQGQLRGCPNRREVGENVPSCSWTCFRTCFRTCCYSFRGGGHRGSPDVNTDRGLRVRTVVRTVALP